MYIFRMYIFRGLRFRGNLIVVHLLSDYSKTCPRNIRSIYKIIVEIVNTWVFIVQIPCSKLFFVPKIPRRIRTKLAAFEIEKFSLR